MLSCDFPWGCVSFPKGPNAEDYLYADVVNIWGIPNVYDEETSHMLQQIFALYYTPTPGVDNETAWMNDLLNPYRTDDRAIEEYSGMARENGHQVANKTYLLGQENDVLGPTLFWALGNGTPIEIVEAAREAWQHRLNVFNGDETEDRLLDGLPPAVNREDAFHEPVYPRRDPMPAPGPYAAWQRPGNNPTDGQNT